MVVQHSALSTLSRKPEIITSHFFTPQQRCEKCVCGWGAGIGPAIDKGSVGVGALRLWPGGLALSRAIGDFDVGEALIPLPYISQVRACASQSCYPDPDTTAL